MQEEDRSRYETLFYCQKLEDGFLSGDGARALFIRSKLPLSDLTRIWKLSDVTHDNKLDVFEFSLAVYLIELKLCGYEIPKQLASSLYVNVKKDVVLSRITEKERQRFQKLFRYKDTNCHGYLDKKITQPLMVATGLSPSVLAKVWNIADLDRDGRLSLIEFTIAFHILKNCLNGVSLEGPVNPFQCFPDEDNTIRMCKEKLKVFDKDYLLKKKETRVESIFFVSSIQEIPDDEFDLLVQCMSPAVLTMVIGSQTGLDENSNTHSKETKINSINKLENDLGVVHVSTEESHRIFDDTKEKIECEQIVKNELSVHLESVFETFDVKPGGYFEGYTPPPKVNYEIEEEPVEEDVLLPVFQRTSYVGKTLIFEDPIGSETIGDVELEIDLESIIHETEKESEDEERELPVARVLPLYKTPPVYIEPPVEKKTVTKNVDLNIISDLDLKQETRGDIEVIYDPLKTSSINRTDKDNSVSQNNQEISLTITNEKNKISEILAKTNHIGDDYFSPVKNNLDLKDEVIDIVEQKRIIVINQAKERKELREKIWNDETNYRKLPQSSTVIDKPCENKIEKKTNNANNCRGEHVKSREEDVSEENISFLEKKEPLVAVSVPKIETSYVREPLENKPVPKQTAKSEFILTALNADVRKEQTNEEVNRDKEERRRKEIEEKEKLLLERIKLLEKKRLELLEKKRQDAELKAIYFQQNIVSDHELGEKMKVTSTSHDSKVMKTKEKCVDVWENNIPQNVHPGPKIISEEEIRRLALAAEEKRIMEAELEKRRQIELKEAEKRRKEKLAKEEEEREAAKERRQHFLENLEKLKQRVFTEEADKTSKRQAKHGHPKSMVGVVSQAMDTYMGSEPKENVRDVYNNKSTKNSGKMVGLNQSDGAKCGENGDETSIEKHSSMNRNEELEIHDVLQKNFNLHRERFMSKAESQADSSEVIRRDKSKKPRPKSYYGGMFNKPVHQIIDDSLLLPNRHEDLNSPDLVDEEALKQYKREEEFKKEHEKAIKHRRSLERNSSYTVENLEKIWDIDIDPQPQVNRRKRESSPSKKTKPSANPNRRSLVNTLTTEWNSFIDILEEDKMHESHTIKMRQEISEQRKSSLDQTKKIEKTLPSSSSNEKKNKTPKDVTPASRANEQYVESDSEVFAKQFGKVKQLVKSYKRLSAPCLHDVDWKCYATPIITDEATERSDRIKTSPHHPLKRQDPMKDKDINELDVKRQQQKTIIKDNAPRRKPDLAHAWSNVVSHQ